MVPHKDHHVFVTTADLILAGIKAIQQDLLQASHRIYISPSHITALEQLTEVHTVSTVTNDNVPVLPHSYESRRQESNTPPVVASPEVHHPPLRVEYPAIIQEPSKKPKAPKLYFAPVLSATTEPSYQSCIGIKGTQRHHQHRQQQS
jgi:hypothetical protein